MLSAGCVYIYPPPLLNILFFVVLLRFNKKSSKNTVGNEKQKKKKNSEWSGMEEWIRGDRGGENHGAIRIFTLWRAVYFIYIFFFFFCFKKEKTSSEKRRGPLTMAVGDSVLSTPIVPLAPPI
jgi:hypothetical protein